MTLQELLAKDTSFNSSLFLSKANNLLKMIYNLISLDDIEKIKSYVSEEVFKKIEDKVENAKSKNEKINYEEISVSCEIREIVENPTNFQIIVNATTKYLKYYTSLDNGQFLRGNNTDRTEVIHIVTFQKEKTAAARSYNCLGCGAPINIYNNGFKCPNCGRMFDFSDFDFIIKSFV